MWYQIKIIHSILWIFSATRNFMVIINIMNMILSFYAITTPYKTICLTKKLFIRVQWLNVNLFRKKSHLIIRLINKTFLPPLRMFLTGQLKTSLAAKRRLRLLEIFFESDLRSTKLIIRWKYIIVCACP